MALGWEGGGGTSIVSVPIRRVTKSIRRSHPCYADVAAVPGHDRREGMFHRPLGGGNADGRQPVFAAVGRRGEVNALRPERGAARAPKCVKSSGGVGS